MAAEAAMQSNRPSDDARQRLVSAIPRKVAHHATAPLGFEISQAMRVVSFRAFTTLGNSETRSRRADRIPALLGLDG